MDEYEYDYLPDNFIKVFKPEIRIFNDPVEPKEHLWLDMGYTHKFDSLNLNELQVRCWTEGIKIFCVMNGTDYECYKVFEEQIKNS